LLMCR